ncbi:heart- and neural crest derivatives-expressed protein 2-like [Condylostylus longicornis]|uniref:heart- and neural crest derivatives-expressed protein 2-like n=1 Tax=Condylostylus longicornis TaxID=2530218 RepID=UPI00244DE214|nr:heart- and neural crest derivatives-expressed protein 2-like [Condylostylus longicornis]
MEHRAIRQNIPKEIQYPSSEITPFPRVVKKRNTANKKERRRTQSINTAFSSLRNKIPNVPVDTKLSKIKTLRLATSYILYLTRVLEGNQDPSNGFQAELITSLKLGKAEKKQLAKVNHEFAIEQEMKYKKNSGRTGWPQDVWASELKQEGRQLN